MIFSKYWLWFQCLSVKCVINPKNRFITIHVGTVKRLRCSVWLVLCSILFETLILTHKVEHFMRDCWTRSHTDSSCNNDEHEWFLYERPTHTQKDMCMCACVHVWERKEGFYKRGSYEHFNQKERDVTESKGKKLHKQRPVSACRSK